MRDAFGKVEVRPALIPLSPGPNEVLDEEANGILERDRDRLGWAAFRKQTRILFEHTEASRRRREICVGLSPDPAIRLGVYGRATNTRQTWLNGRVCGIKKPKLPTDASGDYPQTPYLFVDWTLRGDTFRGMQ